MAKYHGRVIPKGVMQNMQVRAADTAVCDFNFDLPASTPWLFHIDNANVAIAGGVFNKCFHCPDDPFRHTEVKFP
jgi:hypothetical protein